MKAMLRLSTIIVSLLAAGHLAAAEVTVFAAASLTDSLKELGTAYEKESGDKVRFNFAASNTLAQQIKAGAPADVFFSADEAQMNTLQSAALILRETRVDLLGNKLVVITSTDGPGIARKEELLLASVTRLSIGDPDAVPAGVYAKEWLQKFDLWEKLQPKIVPAVNVRAAMAVVESGNAEAGIVYKTDANTSQKIHIAMEIPDNEGPKIVYPAAVLKDSKNADAARKFVIWLAGAKAGQTFRRFGFSLLN